MKEEMENSLNEINEIERVVKKATDSLLADDGDLLRNDVNERSITHRLACYLQELFPEWNVDCEYNRLNIDTKKLLTYKKNVKSDDTEGTTVFPDIIVHKRGSGKNLLVIEVKKTTNAKKDTCDLEKLDKFKGELGYKHALFLRLKTKTSDIGVEKSEWVCKCSEHNDKFWL
ncbi:MAG: hypothetical protein ACYCT9_13360 [Leptospirillum sp.]|jgi:hypothetical protein